MTHKELLEEAARRLLDDYTTMMIAAYGYETLEKRERGCLRASAYLNSARRVLEMVSEIAPSHPDRLDT